MICVYVSSLFLAGQGSNVSANILGGFFEHINWPAGRVWPSLRLRMFTMIFEHPKREVSQKKTGEVWRKMMCMEGTKMGEAPGTSGWHREGFGALGLFYNQGALTTNYRYIGISVKWSLGHSGMIPRTRATIPLKNDRKLRSVESFEWRFVREVLQLTGKW